MNKYHTIQKLMEDNNGYLFASQVQAQDISRTYLAKYVKENNLEQVAKGIYISEDTWKDELFILQHLYAKIVFSGETALYLHNMIDREYADIYVTIPPGYNQTRLRERDVIVRQEKKANYELGITYVVTNYGNMVRTYDKERCICDLVRKRDKYETQHYSTAIKTFMRDKSKDMSKLMRYAKQFKIHDEIMKYVEVLL